MTTNMYLIKGDWLGSAANTELHAYKIDNINNLNWSVDTPVTPMPLPEDSHKENILVKMEGNTAKMDLSWTLTGGTQFGTVDTTTSAFTIGDDDSVFEHIDEFKERFVPISIGDKYIFLITDESNTHLLFEEGTISNMSFNVSGSSPVVWNASCSFYVGNVVAVLEADIPPSPTLVTFTKVSITSFSYTFNKYDGYSSEPSGDSTPNGHILQVKEGNKGWVTYTRTTSNAGSDGQTPVNITGLTASKKYRMRLAQTNANTTDANQYYWKNAQSTINGVTTSILDLA